MWIEEAGAIIRMADDCLKESAGGRATVGGGSWRKGEEESDAMKGVNMSRFI